MMNAGVDFDPADETSWYFGCMSREETNSILMAESEGGVFLVRDSVSIRGDFVLCVREDSKVSHYIINKIQTHNGVKYRIGDQEFTDLAALLTFYKNHYLDTTSLIRPAPRETFVAKYDFAGRDPEDLPFKKGDYLVILTKDEDQWWTARASSGRRGQVPVPYIQKVDATDVNLQLEAPGYMDPAPAMPQTGSFANKKMPAMARVKQQRIPSAYDRSALKLEVGDMVKVINMHVDGQWEGELNGKTGFFPFMYVEFVSDTEED